MEKQIRETSKALAEHLGFEEVEIRKVLKHNTYKVPHQEREDMIQDLAEGLLNAKPDSIGLAFTICKRRVAKWWEAYKLHSQYDVVYGSETISDGDGGETEIIDALVGELGYQAEVELNLMLEELPKRIRPVVQKRLAGYRMSSCEQSQLFRFARANKV